MEQHQNQEELLEQFEILYDKAHALYDDLYQRSAVNIMMEAKRFAKQHRLLMPYIQSCFSITNDLQDAYDPELGIDNAMEMIAYLEDPDKAKAFQNDFDEDYYNYMVHQLSACAYDNLAVHTALRLGYNSPTVFGAVDDGFHVCRRTGKLECIDCFREYATRICIASGDYEMGEYYARQNAFSTNRKNTDDRCYVGFGDLIDLSILQGKLQAAFEYFEEVFPYARKYHHVKDALTNLAFTAERLFWLAGKEEAFDEFLAAHGLDSLPERVPREENGDAACEYALTDAVKLARTGKFLEAAALLADLDRYLLARDVVNPWFPIRIARIANLLLAQQAGMQVDDNIDRLINETVNRANEAHHWSAINSLNAMKNGTVPLNPLGIAYPIDLGPYAAEGTPVSSACLVTTLPLVEPSPRPVADEKSDDSKENADDSPLLQEAKQRYERLAELWVEQNRFEFEKRSKEQEGIDVDGMTFPKQAELDALEKEAYDRALSITLQSYPSLTPDELHAFARPLLRESRLGTAEEIRNIWVWIDSFEAVFKGLPRYLTTRSSTAHVCRKEAERGDIAPASLGLPEGTLIMRWIAKAFEQDAVDSRIAIAAGTIFQENGQEREAQYYFSRACQLERSNDYATKSLVDLYLEAERPKDALAVIDLYCRAGGRHPQLLFNAMQIAIESGMYQSFFLYYNEFVKTNEAFILPLELWRFQAYFELSQFDDAIKQIDKFDELTQEKAADRYMLRALCLAQKKEDWIDPFNEAIKMIRENSCGDCFLSDAIEPCQRLWDYVAAALPESDERRTVFAKFILRRGLAPQSYFAPPEPESKESECDHHECTCDKCNEHDSEEDSQNDDEFDLGDSDAMNETSYKNLYRIVIKQNLDPSVPAYAGWSEIPSEMSAYFAPWFVLADSQDEAEMIALEEQKECYPAGDCTVVKSEEHGAYPENESRILVQAARQSQCDDEREE